MKRLAILLIIILTILSCSKINRGIIANNETANFLNLFETLTTDSLKIESSDSLNDWPSLDFKGKLIDTTYLYFIDDNKIKFAYENDNYYYACYKKILSDSILLLIMRIPNEYWENSIQLYLFDLNKTQTTAYLEVAQKWNDAGDYSEKYSTINKNLITSFTKDCYLIDEEKLETICYDSIFQFQIVKDKFILKKSE